MLESVESRSKSSKSSRNGTRHRRSHQASASKQQYTTTQYTTAEMQQPGPQMYRQGSHTLRQPSHLYKAGSTLSATETVLGERIIEREVRVPKRVVREDIFEKVVVVPEKVIREEIVEQTINVREKIIEVAKPIIQEKIVEIPEYEYVEKIIEVPERVIKEKIREVPVTKYEERIIHVPKIITQERIVEVPEIEYREVPVEKIVEVPEIREQIVVKEVSVPQYIDKPTPEYVNVEVPREFSHKIPVPVEAASTFAFKIPKLQPKYSKVELTLYVPRFIEVPVPAEFMESASRTQAEQFAAQVNLLAQQRGASLCEVENLAGFIKSADFSGVIQSNQNFSEALNNAWKEGRLQVFNDGQDARMRGATQPSYTTAKRSHGQSISMGLQGQPTAARG